MTEHGVRLLELRDFALWRRTAAGEHCLLDGIDLQLFQGESVALLGANGAGKSSLLRFLAGPESPLTVATALVFQDPDEGFVTAMVAEEISLGRPFLDVAAWLADFGLAGRESIDPRRLSAGEKQRLALAIALAGRPAVLLCDEPTTLQDRVSATWVRARLARWREESGGTLLFASQSREEVGRADRALLLAEGRVVAAGPPDAILARPDVATLLDRQQRACPVGRGLRTPSVAAAVGRMAPLPATACELPALALEEVTCRFGEGRQGFAGITLRVSAGERVGITGPNGCGKSTLLAIIAGLRRPDNGRCHLGTRLLYAGGEPDLDHGLAALAPQFPEYLFSRPTVAAEIALDPLLGAGGVARVLSAAGLPIELAEHNPHDLSSGQRRSLAVALVLLSGRPLLLLDEPTAALDASACARVVSLVEAAPADAAVIIASHDESLLAACGCRQLCLTPEGLRPAPRR